MVSFKAKEECAVESKVLLEQVRQQDGTLRRERWERFPSQDSLVHLIVQQLWIEFLSSVPEQESPSADDMELPVICKDSKL